MINVHSAATPMAERMPTASERAKGTSGLYRLLSSLFAREGVSEAVSTRAHFDASPEAVWSHIMFYEEVPGRPPLILRTLLPCPARTEGNKALPGTEVRCVYTRGGLVKLITTVEQPHLLRFDVIEQRLGIEGCILTLSGSYDIYACGNATAVALTTHYRAYLRPRSIWRPLEAILMRQLHGHILRGVCAAIRSGNPAVQPAAESLAPTVPL
jgi:hypothetical protein